MPDTFFTSWNKRNHFAVTGASTFTDCCTTALRPEFSDTWAMPAVLPNAPWSMLLLPVSMEGTPVLWKPVPDTDTLDVAALRSVAIQVLV